MQSEKALTTIFLYSVGGLFSIKLQAGGTISTSHCWYTNYATYKKSKLFARFTQCVVTRNKSPVIVCILPIYLMSGQELWWWPAKKNQRSLFKVVKAYEVSVSILCWSRLFYSKHLPSWNTTGIACYLSYTLAKENFPIFLFTLLRHLLPNDWFYYFRKLICITCIYKRLCYCSLFILHVRETREQY